MKFLLTIILASTFLACKDDTKTIDIENNSIQEDRADSLRVSDKDLERQIETFSLKRKELLEKKDNKEELENMLISKLFFKKGDWYTIDFKYPYLNEKLKPSFENFNDYIEKSYLDAEGVEKEILEEKRLCDSLGCPKLEEKRLVDYKIYNRNEKLISILFYKENYYTGAVHSAYTFETLNFDLERSVFMNYEDFFNEGSEEEMQDILNDLLKEKINSGEFYFDCWEISIDDFFDAKNNFVIDDKFVEFYFDDCIICPSYTGTYSIQIPLKLLMPVIRRYKKNHLIAS